MTDRPEDRPPERRRTGPLGDDPGGSRPDRDETRQISREELSRGETEDQRTRQTPDEQRTRVARASETRRANAPRGTETTRGAAAWPGGYYEAAEERHERLRELYGGVDWLASFIGFVFAAVVGAVLFALAGLVLVPLGFSLDLTAAGLGAGAITGLVFVAVLLFLTYFCGGYVAGRLARFDGGRNGAMTVLWSLISAVILAVAGTFLPGAFFDQIGAFLQTSVVPAVGGIAQLGAIGAAVLGGALLVELLGGFLGGRAGSRYHTDIDRTS